MTLPGRNRWAPTCPRMRSGGHRMSSSTKRTTSPREARNPVLRAAAGPAFRCWMQRSEMGGQVTRDSTTGATGSGEPSSTTMISTASSPLVSLASNASRVAPSFSPRPYVGMITLAIMGCVCLSPLACSPCRYVGRGRDNILFLGLETPDRPFSSGQYSPDKVNAPQDPTRIGLAERFMPVPRPDCRTEQLAEMHHELRGGDHLHAPFGPMRAQDDIGVVSGQPFDLPRCPPLPHGGARVVDHD